MRQRSAVTIQPHMDAVASGTNVGTSVRAISLFRAGLLTVAMSLTALTCGTSDALGQAARSGSFSQCDDHRKWKRDGVVRVQIDRHTFALPRTILQTVTLPDGRYEFSWRCEDKLIVANSFFLRASRNAGNEFYKDWITRRRLPIDIEIVRRGRIKSFTDDRLRQAKERLGPSTSADDFGFVVTSIKPETYFDATPLGLTAYGGRGIVFACSNISLPNAGHNCRVSYPLDDILDVVYHFPDALFPRNDWKALDGRLRELVRGLLEAPSKP